MSSIAIASTVIPQKPVFHIEECNCLDDVLFKHLFGSPKHKSFTIDLLNTFLAEELGRDIKDLSFGPQETVPDLENGKETRFDVACTLDGGEKVNIEVQMLDQKNMRQRTLYYWSDMYYHKLGKGDGYKSLVPMITFNILNFVLFDDIPSPFTSWAIYEKHTHQRFHQDLSLNFLEITKFSQSLNLVRPLSKTERWMCYFSSSLTMSQKWQVLQGDSVMTQAMTVANDFFNNPAEFEHYRIRERLRRDRESEREGLLEEGWAKGREEGMVIGEEMAIARLINHLPVDEIARLYGRSAEEIRGIAQRHHMAVF